MSLNGWFSRRWWSRIGEEIDLVLAGQDETWVGEVKWSSRPEGPETVSQPFEKTPRVERLGHAAVRPFVVARGGVTPAAEALLKERGGFALNLRDIVTLLEKRAL